MRNVIHFSCRYKNCNNKFDNNEKIVNKTKFSEPTVMLQRF